MRAHQIKIIWKSRLGQLWRMMNAKLHSSDTGHSYILTYHSIGEDQYSIPAAVFDGQMRYLAEHTRVVPLR